MTRTADIKITIRQTPEGTLQSIVYQGFTEERGLFTVARLEKYGEKGASVTDNFGSMITLNSKDSWIENFNKAKRIAHDIITTQAELWEREA